MKGIAEIMKRITKSVDKATEKIMAFNAAWEGSDEKEA